MSPPVTHIVGAGLAGLSTAIRLIEAGQQVALYESSPQAGGRCRSYFDDVLGCRIDNGNHLILSGNDGVMRYLDTVGARDSLAGPPSAQFPFVDLATNERWTVSLNDGVLPLWLFDSSARLPGTKPWDYLSALKFAFARQADTVDDVVGRQSPLFRRFWEPLAVAALNTATSEGQAALLWPVLRQTFGRGGKFARPLLAKVGLSESLIDPALTFLRRHNTSLALNTRVRDIELTGQRATALHIAGGTSVVLRPEDTLVLAVPPPVAASLIPDLTVPTEFRSILNAHYRLPAPPISGVEITGVIGGNAEWVFRRESLASVTVSAADRFMDSSAETLAQLLWDDVVRTLNLTDRTLPAWRIVKEKRATFAQTPTQIARRPRSQTKWANLLLAGDWTDTGLPVTIESAIRSGETAAKCVLAAS